MPYSPYGNKEAVDVTHQNLKAQYKPWKHSGLMFWPPHSLAQPFQWTWTLLCARYRCCIAGFLGLKVHIFQMITSRHHLELPECKVALSGSKHLSVCGSLQRQMCRSPVHHHFPVYMFVWIRRDGQLPLLYLAPLFKPQTLLGNTLHWPYFSSLISVLT